MTVAIAPDEVTSWSRYVHEISGIALDETKGYLIETRLRALLAETAATNFSELLRRTRADASNVLRKKVLESITTNETSFFRDAAPFDLLRHKLLPEFIDRRSRAGQARTPIRIWSAACSTGQEAYSTAIVLKEALGDLSRHDIRILGTDISNKAVAQASYAEYSKLEIQRGLTDETLRRHFNAHGEKWRVRDELRALATFRTMNLLEPFAFPAPFDLIFCRNVAIYFNETDKIRLLRNLARSLAPHGSLILGATETIGTCCPELESRRHLRTVFYQRQVSPAG